ncbi:p-glycoprotein [Lichtheimia hyalospora FSU 10163]|nr:p-glycoprotein [Lichtheimia hyalospora FSU 10163]
MNAIEEKRVIPMRILFRFATPTDKYLIIAGSICSICVGVLQTSCLTIFAQSTSDAVEAIYMADGSLTERLQPAVVRFAIVGGVLMVLSYSGNALWIIVGENQVQSIRRYYITSLLRQDMKWFDTRTMDHDTLTTRLALDMQQLQDGISERFGGLIRSISAFSSGFLMALFMGAKAAVVVLPTIPLLAFMAYLTIHLLVHCTYKLQDAYGDAGSVAQQVFDNIRTVYSYSLQHRFINMYKAHLIKARQAGVHRGLYGGLCYSALVSVLLMTYALALWYAGIVISKGEIDSWRALTSILGMMLGSIAFLQVPGHMSAIAAAYTAARKIFDIIDNTPTIDNPTIAKPIPPIQGDIEFRHVTFAYPNRPDMHVLKNINLSIKRGTTVAFVGSSGSGKSTCIQLIQRLYDVSAGQLLIDGKDITTINVRWLRHHIGVVQQEPKLFNTTIRENLLLGVPNRFATQEQIVQACVQANCHDFITALPEGYDTNVGTYGSKLSVGQRQRIAIARAIINNPPILLLDEATSALDTNSELAVQQSLKQASSNRTLIVIAQRLSTVQGADQIFVIQKGEIAQVGTHQQLLQQRGSTYAKLVRLQEIALQRIQQPSKGDDGDAATSTNKHVKDTECKQHGTTRRVTFSVQESAETPHERSLSLLSASCRRERHFTKIFTMKNAPILKIFRQMHKERWLLAVGFLGSAMAGFIFPFVAYVIGQSTLNLVQRDQEQQYGMSFRSVAEAYAVWILVSAIASFIIYAVQVIPFAVAGEQYTERLRSQVFHAYLKQEVSYFDHHTTSNLATRLAVDAKNVNELVTRVPGDIVQIISTAITGLVISYLQNPLMTGVVCALAPVVMGASFYEAHTQRSYEHRALQAHEQCNIILAEAVKEIHTVVALGQQPYFEVNYVKETEKAHGIVKRKAIFASIGYALNQGFMMHVVALSLHLGAEFIDDGSVDATSMYVCLLCVLVSVHSIGRLGAFRTTYARAKQAAIATCHVLERTPDIDPDLEGLSPSTNKIQGDISFRDIAFSYPTRPDVRVFDGSFGVTANPGMTIALVGPSGCGKSTAIGLLQRWYDPTYGTITLDGSSTRAYTLDSLRQPMALVSQEPVLFSLSIGDNIWLGSAGKQDTKEDPVTRQQVEDAARLVGMHDFITSLPQGYDTHIGSSNSSHGIQLSGGQKQRIALARALLGQPKILLLDEATSALDAESEQQVQNAIDQLIHQADRTIFIIAHQLATVQNADLICYVRDGRIIEQGTHWELLRKRGEYAALVRLQSLK